MSWLIPERKCWSASALTSSGVARNAAISQVQSLTRSPVAEEVRADEAQRADVKVRKFQPSRPIQVGVAGAGQRAAAPRSLDGKRTCSRPIRAGDEEALSYSSLSVRPKSRTASPTARRHRTSSRAARRAGHSRAALEPLNMSRSSPLRRLPAVAEGGVDASRSRPRPAACRRPREGASRWRRAGNDRGVASAPTAARFDDLAVWGEVQHDQPGSVPRRQRIGPAPECQLAKVVGSTSPASSGRCRPRSAVAFEGQGPRDTRPIRCDLSAIERSPGRSQIGRDVRPAEGPAAADRESIRRPSSRACARRTPPFPGNSATVALVANPTPGVVERHRIDDRQLEAADAALPHPAHLACQLAVRDRRRTTTTASDPAVVRRLAKRRCKPPRRSVGRRRALRKRERREEDREEPGGRIPVRNIA